MSRSTQTLVLEPKPARMGRMDVAVNLVESYLRLNGYLTLSELEIQGKTEDGSFETLTDVDIVALRFPGAMYAADAHDQDEAALLLIDDDELRLEEDVVDLIIGEVKQGEAVFNAGLRRHQVLHAVLRRVEWLLDGSAADVVDILQEQNVAHVPVRGGGLLRARLVAFGRSPHSDLHTIALGHIVETMAGFMEEFDEVLRPAQFKDPAPALLRLLIKTGFSVERSADPQI